MSNETKQAESEAEILKEFVTKNQIQLAHDIKGPHFEADRFSHEFRILSFNGRLFIDIAKRLNEYDKLKAENAAMREMIKDLLFLAELHYNENHKTLVAAREFLKQNQE